MSLRVIAVGSPMPGDDLAWRVADALRREHPGVDIHSLDRPGPSLIQLMSGCDAVIILDATLGLNSPCRWLSPAELAPAAQKLSGHDFGVAEALLLARTLNALPPSLQLLALRADDAPDIVVSCALDCLCRRLQRPTPDE